jgi:uncharacterized protein (DUF2164 family)
METILKQIDAALEEFKTIQPRLGRANTPREDLKEVYVRLASTMDRLSPPGSFHKKHFERSMHGSVLKDRILSMAGLLRALRYDYANGYLQTVQELVHADMFANFLDMAAYLHDQGFKDAAAVIGGGVLEQHLRELCEKNGIKTLDDNQKPRKAEILNQDLRSQDIYNLLEQKSVTAWLDLRNSAAHGKYDQYDARQVQDLMNGIREFMTRHPA